MCQPLRPIALAWVVAACTAWVDTAPAQAPEVETADTESSELGTAAPHSADGSDPAGESEATAEGSRRADAEGDEARAETVRLQRRLERITGERDGLADELSALQRRFDIASEELDQAKADLLERDIQLGEARTQLEERTGELSAATERSAASATRVEGLERRLKVLQEEANAAQKGLAAARKALDEKTQAYTVLEREMMALELAKKQQDERADGLVAEVANLQDQFTEGQAELTRMQQENRRLGEALAARERVLEQLRTDLGQREQDHAQVRAELEVARALADRDGDGVVNPLDLCMQSAAEVEVDETGCAAETEIPLPEVTFAFGESTLEPDSIPVLARIAETLLHHPSLRLEVAGYTDSNGDRSANMAISRFRAEAVRDYLLSRGVPAERLTARGYGPDNPIADNDTAEGRARNRRVALRRLGDS